MPESMPHPSEGVHDSLVHHVFAMQRSGHHAVMAWLQGCYEQAGLSTGHLNDVYHGHVLGAEVIDPTGSEVLQASGSHDVTFVNYEDLGYGQRHHASNYRDVHAAPHVVSHDMVILRDWYNMAASRLQSIDKAKQSDEGLQLHDLPWEQVAQAWQDHASYVLVGSRAVLYNQWFDSLSYRQSAAAQFGLRNSDRSLDSVPIFGRGSSFDGMIYASSGRKMGVLERWNRLSLESHELLIEVSESFAAIAALNSRLFNFDLSRVKQDFVGRTRTLLM